MWNLCRKNFCVKYGWARFSEKNIKFLLFITGFKKGEGSHSISLVNVSYAIIPTFVPILIFFVG